MPQLTFAAFVVSRAAILNFEVPRGQIITEILAEIDAITMPKMSESHLLDIWQGGVGYVDLMCVNKVREAVLICLPPVLGCLCWHWQKWGECGMMVVCCGVWVGPVSMVK
jgi:hypothetical protein